ncbi:uncharacterized protein C9orf43 homolog isoform X2 [Arvicanthis niloticus]|uniref:uncharacterized protein C9orf43 homolog isoform X2 n=1 Tax=Arvicanthis niloticus TaxID=61156 RepID=UPI0014863066|nr:uncharacterized protein C9orf43 homolog [Arvicanthis niloticus]
MRLRSSIGTGSVQKGQEAFDSVNLADESLWDEAICTLAGCQHPQCWASLRRIERGHPRILDTSPKSPQEPEDKLPTLTVVNIMDTCLWTQKRVVPRQPSEFTFLKDRSPLSKPTSKRQSRSPKALRDKDVTSRSPRPPKLSVLNLNEAELPFPEGDRNMVMTWVPEGAEKKIRPVQKTAVSTWPEKRRKKQREKSKPSLYPGRRYLKSPAVIVPPPSPVHFLDQLSSENIPLWAQVDMLPQDLLKECILEHEKAMSYPEVKIELSKMRKSLPLEKSRTDSAISSKMYLTIQRLTLQKPSLRYPARLRKLRSRKRGEGSSESLMQQGKSKTSKKQKAGRSVLDQYGMGEETMSRSFFHDQEGFSMSGQENEQKLLEEEETSSERHVPLDEVYEFGSYYTDYYTSAEEGDGIYDTIYQDLDEEEETVVGVEGSSKDSSPKNLSRIMDGIGWNPELKLLRILQATEEEEEEESHHSKAQGEAPLEA